LHADTPPRYLSCDTKKMEVQRYQKLKIMKILVQQLFSRMYCISSKRDEAFLWHFSTFFGDNW
jgi:hypothetical protein